MTDRPARPFLTPRTPARAARLPLGLALSLAVSLAVSALAGCDEREVGSLDGLEGESRTVGRLCAIGPVVTPPGTPVLREEAPGCDTGACLRPAGVEPSRAGASYANDPRVADRAADGECTASCEADADCERFRASAAGCPGPYVCARPLGAGAAACRRLCVCSARLGRVVAESPATFPRPACAAPSGLVAALPGGALLAPTGDGCAPVSTTIEIRNEGAQATGALEVALDEAAGAAGPFRVGEPACAGALAPGAGCAVTITYDPRAAGPGATRLVVRAAPGGTLVVPLAGAPGACGGAAAGGTGDYRAAGPAAPGR